MKTTPDIRPLAERITQGGSCRVTLAPQAVVGKLGGHIAKLESHPVDGGDPAANAMLIVETFNVTHETGRTPRQLADERAELIAALSEAVAYIQAGFPELEDDDETITTSADDGPEATFQYAAALKLIKP